MLKSANTTPHRAHFTLANFFSRVAQAELTLCSSHCLVSLRKIVISIGTGHVSHAVIVASLPASSTSSKHPIFALSFERKSSGRRSVKFDKDQDNRFRNLRGQLTHNWLGIVVIFGIIFINFLVEIIFSKYLVVINRLEGVLSAKRREL